MELYGWVSKYQAFSPTPRISVWKPDMQADGRLFLLSFCCCDLTLGPKAMWEGKGYFGLYSQISNNHCRKSGQEPKAETMKEQIASQLWLVPRLTLSYLSCVGQTCYPRDVGETSRANWEADTISTLDENVRKCHLQTHYLVIILVQQMNPPPQNPAQGTELLCDNRSVFCYFWARK